MIKDVRVASEGTGGAKEGWDGIDTEGIGGA